jgi:PAS domain S-box-containing protein
MNVKVSQIKVLLVEDNPGDARLIRALLDDAGSIQYVLKHSNTLTDGLVALSENAPDVILLDIGLPDISGLDSVPVIKNLAPKLPIIMLTGLDDENTAISCLHLGVQDYLVKGKIDSELLVRSIRYAIERKRVESELQEKQHFIQRITEATPNILYVLDINEHRLSYVNQQLNIVLGHSEDAIQKMGINLYRELVHHDDLTNLDRYSEQFLKAKDSDIINMDLRVKHANGEWRWFSFRNVIFTRTEDGLPRQVLGSAQDITEQKRVEIELLRHRKYLMELVEDRTKELQRSNESLRSANELLENVFSNVHVLIAYMDRDFNFIKVNSTYAEADGKDPAFFIGKNHFDLFPNTENENIFRNVVMTGKPYFTRAKPFEYVQSPERGTTFWDWSLKPVIDIAGRVSGLVLSLIDVTDNIVLYGELMRADHLASIGKLAAGVAHEINNPINGIINYAQILLNRSGQENMEKDIAGRIIKESDRIAGIVSSLLSFSRDNKGAKAPVYVEEILDDSLALTEIQLKKKGIKINIDVPHDLPRIFANKQQIEQVMLNMINNSRYALLEKYPQDHNDKIIGISGKKIIKGGGHYVRIIFYDNGTGIPREIQGKITDPFFSTKPEGEGTGLGLSISHGIVMDHQGSFKIESREGEFTRIIIDLPAAVGKSAEA